MKAEYDSLTTRIKTEESKQTKTLTSLTEEVHFYITLHLLVTHRIFGSALFLYEVTPCIASLNVSSFHPKYSVH